MAKAQTKAPEQREETQHGIWGVRVYDIAQSKDWMLCVNWDQGEVLTFASQLDARTEAANQNQNNSQDGAFGFLAVPYQPT